MNQLCEDERFMAAALALGRRGFGLCAPNPSAGAIIVKKGVIAGRGWTKQGGRPHAETEALQSAGADAKGATLYVTLEPCSHHGQTPPCTDAIIAAGISRVVYATDDPDPRASGSAAGILESAGIEVAKGVLEAGAKRAHRGHFLRITEKRPMIGLKLALTADSFAAAGTGAPRLRITGAAANGFVHVQRAMHDAILIGIGTALVDDPLLTVRLPGVGDRAPLRIVLDSDLRLPLDARLALTAGKVPVLVIAGVGASEEKAARLRAVHAEVSFVRRDAAGHADLMAALNILAARGLTRVFCEGGPLLASALIGQGLADEVTLLTAPEPLGRPGVFGLDRAASAVLADPRCYLLTESRTLGADKLARYERVV